MTERELNQALTGLADESVPARLPPDLWTRGRRRRWRTVAAAVGAGVVLAAGTALPVMTSTRPSVGAPADRPPAVPAQVYAPFPFQATAQRAPAGPAALLVNGGPGFRGWSYEDRSLAVGRDGSYRVIRSVNDQWVGETLLLSPGGRYVAAGEDLEAAPDLHDTADTWSTSVLDLTTGRVRGYRDVGHPEAWSPDGRHLLTRTQASRAGGWLKLVDVRSGQSRDVFPLVSWSPPPFFVAFSPDGRRLAVQRNMALHVVDLTSGTHRKIADTGPRQRLAGPGAWTSDSRIAMWDMTGCDADCTVAEVDTRVFRVAYLDPDRGVEVYGPRLSEVTGLGVRILGWQQDGDAVVVVFHPAADVPPGRQIPVSWQKDDGFMRGDAEVFALHSDGGRTELVTFPHRADSVDIARDLLVADRFGGPAPSLAERFGDWLAPLVGRILLFVAGVVVLLSVRRFWRKFRERRAVPARRA